MATRQASDQKIQLSQMAGLNERPAPNALPSPFFSICQGLYPAQDGALERLPGKLLLATATNGILNLTQLDDGTGNVIVQDDEGNEIIYALDELFGRPAAVSNLVFTPQDEEDSMSLAIIVHTETVGTNGGTVNSGGAAALNTFYRQKLTAVNSNEDTIVTNFVADGGGVDENTFELAAGTYRAEITVVFGISMTARSTPLAGTVAITIASPAVVTLNNHGLTSGTPINFSTSGALPTGITPGTTYYVIGTGLTTNTFRFSATLAGAAVNTTGTQSGVHTVNAVTPLPTSATALYDETNSARLLDLIPVSQSATYINSASNNIAALFDRNAISYGTGSFVLSGTSKLSLQAAVNNSSSVNLANSASCRGFTHGLTTALGGTTIPNFFTVIKIIKQP